MAIQLADLDAKQKPSFVSSGLFTALISEETREILPRLKKDKQFDYLLYFLLCRVVRSLEQEVLTQTPDVQINYNYVHTLINMKPWFERERNAKEIELESLFSIVRKFSEVKKVKSIYVQKYREEIQVFVLLSITQYNSDLMDTLLDIEYDVRKTYPNLVFEFFYPPAGISNKEDFIHPQSQCIYAR